MERDELEYLTEQVELLRREIADVREALKMEISNTTEHMASFYRYIADIHSYLMPVVQKVFPGCYGRRTAVDEFVERYAAQPDPKRSH
jgi:hypothetical protein